MLLSMTGFGEAHLQRDGLNVSVEVRTINSRYLKVSTRISEGYSALEAMVERVVRQQVRRATAQVNIHIRQSHSPDDYKINVAVLEGYRRQLEALHLKNGESVPVASLLLLPGVVSDADLTDVDAMGSWPLVQETIVAALANLDRMRTEEGRAMTVDLEANCRAISASLELIAARAPVVVNNYRERLSERLKRALGELSVTLDEADILKEVSLFADRSDISEEVVRLRSHLEQFATIMQAPESTGRKLEFLTQEMVREANTIGSKANDVEIARHVIEIKAAVERIREMIQNVE